MAAPSTTPVARSVVIPMYRESERIPATLLALAGSALDRPDTELLLVDDGSDDATVVEATRRAGELGLRVTVIERPHRGKGAAVAAGMLRARGAALVFTDADLSTGVDDVVACLEAVEQGDADVVVATRTHPESRVDARGSRVRKVTGWTFNRALRALGLTTLRDTQCGLKGFSRASAERLFTTLATPGFAFDIELLARADLLGLRVVELPVTWAHVPASRVRILREAPTMLRDALRIRRVLATAVEPAADDAVVVDLGVDEEPVAPLAMAETSRR